MGRRPNLSLWGNLVMGTFLAVDVVSLVLIWACHEAEPDMDFHALARISAVGAAPFLVIAIFLWLLRVFSPDVSPPMEERGAPLVYLFLSATVFLFGMASVLGVEWLFRRFTTDAMIVLFSCIGAGLGTVTILAGFIMLHRRRE